MIFIDTGAFLARYIKRDQYHEQALRYWKDLESSRQRLFTSNFILDETITLLARRSTNAFAAARARTFYESSALQVIAPSRNDEIAAIEALQKYANQSISFTDAVSFILMQRYEIKTSFTFDNHFAIAGFNVVPQSV